MCRAARATLRPMKYEVHRVGHRLEAIGAHSGYRIRMSTIADDRLETFPISVHIRGSESEPEVKVDTPQHQFRSADEAFEHGYRCATMWIDAWAHRKD